LVSSETMVVIRKVCRRRSSNSSSSSSNIIRGSCCYYCRCCCCCYHYQFTLNLCWMILIIPFIHLRATTNDLPTKFVCHVCGAGQRVTRPHGLVTIPNQVRTVFNMCQRPHLMYSIVSYNDMFSCQHYPAIQYSL
jgi:hypothetical protein